VRHLSYLGLLVACLVATLPLELFLKVRVYRRWRRLVLAVLPVTVLFVAWDVVAIQAGWWSFDRRDVTGLRFGLPVEEVAFFIVVPICAILTLEAARRVRPFWLVGDEPEREPDQP
jgi:lycopene cyclase domain-containing protein